MWSQFFAFIVLSANVLSVTAGPVRGMYRYAYVPQYRRTYMQEDWPYRMDSPKGRVNSQSFTERQWRKFPDKVGAEVKPGSENPLPANYPAYLEDPRIQAAIPTWPDGTYALPKPLNGCPFTFTFQWSQGWILQDTENDKNLYQSPSEGKNLDVYDAKDFIVTQFCTKDSTVGDSGLEWPPGSYCIAKFGSCPNGFQEGSIFWDDKNSGNRNTHGGALPDGQYTADTRLDYCCRSDAPITNKITLPYLAPFYLMCLTGDGCQRVRYMKVMQESLQWDDENTDNHDYTLGKHPFDDGDPHNHRLNYCYYTPKYTE